MTVLLFLLVLAGLAGIGCMVARVLQWTPPVEQRQPKPQRPPAFKWRWLTHVVVWLLAITTVGMGVLAASSTGGGHVFISGHIIWVDAFFVLGLAGLFDAGFDADPHTGFALGLAVVVYAGVYYAALAWRWAIRTLIGIRAVLLVMVAVAFFARPNPEDVNWLNLVFFGVWFVTNGTLAMAGNRSHPVVWFRNWLRN